MSSSGRAAIRTRPGRSTCAACTASWTEADDLEFVISDPRMKEVGRCGRLRPELPPWARLSPDQIRSPVVSRFTIDAPRW
jgi:hypothetical protein